MADIDKLAVPQSEVLGILRMCIEETLMELQIAKDRSRLSTVAWLARNLLELRVWATYCSDSEDHAREFMLDSVRDIHDACDVPDGLLSDTFSFREYREEAIQRTKDDGFETLDQRFTDIRNVARAYGIAEDFRHIYKLLSKFAHPTALSIFTSDNNTTGLMTRFYELGRGVGADAISLIDASLNHPPPADDIKV